MEKKYKIKSILEKADKEQNEAEIRIYQIQAILKMSIEYAFKSEEKNESMDWISIFGVLESIASETQEHISEINSLIYTIKEESNLI